jgi:hypothetical protein
LPWPWSRCYPIFKYDGTNVSFTGLEGPDQVVNFKLGSFHIKKELLAAACYIAKKYMHFFNIPTVKEYNSFLETFSKEVIAEWIAFT